MPKNKDSLINLMSSSYFFDLCNNISDLKNRLILNRKRGDKYGRKLKTDIQKCSC